jgi:hypothetical protein
MASDAGKGGSAAVMGLEVVVAQLCWPPTFTTASQVTGRVHTCGDQRRSALRHVALRPARRRSVLSSALTSRGSASTFGHHSCPSLHPQLPRCRGGWDMTRKRQPDSGSYQHLNAVVIAYLQGRTDQDSAARIILDTHGREQIRAVLFNEGERYRRFNLARFRTLVERLRLEESCGKPSQPD